MKFIKENIPIRAVDVYNSIHPDKSYTGSDYFVTEVRNELNVTLEGIEGDRHKGYTTSSGNRFTSLYQRGSVVRNNRQWSAISPWEVGEIGQNLGIRGLTPQLLGVNLLIDGVNALSKLSPMQYLVFSSEDTFKPGRPEDVTLVVYGEALPCTIAGRALVKPLGDVALENKFSKAAMGSRGTTGWVEHGGVIRPGDYGWILTPTGRD